MGDRGHLRLVKDDTSAGDAALPGSHLDRPLSWGVSMAIWALMAALAWAGVAALLHFL